LIALWRISFQEIGMADKCAPKIYQRQFRPECLRPIFIDLGDEGINTVALLTPTQNSPLPISFQSGLPRRCHQI
jgi:hypothetical protein